MPDCQELRSGGGPGQSFSATAHGHFLLRETEVDQVVRRARVPPKWTARGLRSLDEISHLGAVRIARGSVGPTAMGLGSLDSCLSQHSPNV